MVHEFYKDVKDLPESFLQFFDSLTMQKIGGIVRILFTVFTASYHNDISSLLRQ